MPATLSARPPALTVSDHSDHGNASRSPRTSFESVSSAGRPAAVTPLSHHSHHSSSSELGDNDIIPTDSDLKPRTLVLCFDGTGDQFDADNSNVVHFFKLLKKDDPEEQMVYYQTGIGTYTSPQIATHFGASVAKAMDEAIAWNLDAHVMDGYEFLMQTYRAGDKICLFGFSRGAYTARALAGMLHKVGLLPTHNWQQVPFAYRMYADASPCGWKQSTAFKQAFSIDVDIDFIGVWDTVCSVGLIGHRLPFVTSNGAIKFFRHAMSLDERRAKFKANHYNRPTPDENKLGTHFGQMPRSQTHPHPRSHVKKTTKTTNKVKEVDTTTVKTEEKKTEVEVTEKAAGDATSRPSTLNKGWSQLKAGFATSRALLSPKEKVEKKFSVMEAEANEQAPIDIDTDVKEVWFAGCHCDVGGGSVADDTSHSLSRISLRWMIRECFKCDTGIRFHAELLRDVGIDPAMLYPQVRPRTPSASSHSRPVSSADPDKPLPAPPTDDVPAPKSLVASASAPACSTSRPRAPPMHDRVVSTTTERTFVNTLPRMRMSHVRERTLVDPVAGPSVDEDSEDRWDALAGAYDQLSMKPMWWLLEFLPIKQRKQRKDNTWRKYRSMNLGRGRKIPEECNTILVHRTVQMRMDARPEELPDGKAYIPKLRRWKDVQIIWED